MGLAWGEFIDVKYWPKIKNAKRYAGKEAFFGSVTDCYQPHEAKYKRTRALLEQLQGSGISVSIATKSDLVLRDLDLIRTFPHARVSWSINTLDESFRREMDRGVSIERRLEAMRQFYEAEGLPYVRNDDSVRSRHGEPPVVVNYFFHEEIVNRAK